MDFPSCDAKVPWAAQIGPRHSGLEAIARVRS